MYGFIYITTNHINGKKYIGQKQYDKYGKWKKYLGSGIHLKNAKNKYGVESFSKEIIEECESKELLGKREIYWINFYNAIEDENFYNIALGGDGGNTIIGYSQKELEEYKQRKSVLHKEIALKGENAPRSKLTELEVKEIIKRLLNNDFNSDIAEDYNVSTRTIDDIRQHRTWELQYDLLGNFIKRWNNARKIQEKTGISYKQISQVCNGNKRMFHNFIWRFEEDTFDKYPVNYK